MTYEDEREKWKKNEHMYEDRRIQNKKKLKKIEWWEWKKKYNKSGNSNEALIQFYVWGMYFMWENYVLRRYYNEYKQNISKISIKTKRKMEATKRTCEKKSIVKHSNRPNLERKVKWKMYGSTHKKFPRRSFMSVPSIVSCFWWKCLFICCTFQLSPFSTFSYGVFSSFFHPTCLPLFFFFILHFFYLLWIDVFIFILFHRNNRVDYALRIFFDLFISLFGIGIWNCVKIVDE